MRQEKVDKAQDEKDPQGQNKRLDVSLRGARESRSRAPSAVRLGAPSSGRCGAGLKRVNWKQLRRLLAVIWARSSKKIIVVKHT